jgi:hypothetical protein
MVREVVTSSFRCRHVLNLRADPWPLTTEQPNVHSIFR